MATKKEEKKVRTSNTTFEEHYIYVGDKEGTRVKMKDMGWIVLHPGTKFIITNERALAQIKDDKRFKKESKGGK